LTFLGSSIAIVLTSIKQSTVCMTLTEDLAAATSDTIYTADIIWVWKIDKN